MTIEAWKNATKCIGWTHRVIRETQIWRGNWFKELGKLEGFKGWDNIGISKIGDLLEHWKLAPFTSLQREYQMHPKQHFKYIQIRHAWKGKDWRA